MAQQWIDDNIKENKFPESVAKSIRGYDSIETMLSDVELDALYVATPPGSHLEVIRKIVSTPSRSTLKGIYVEKPCGRCGWETRAIIDELSRKNISFYPAYVSLAHERTQKIMELLRSQVIGERIIKVKYTQRGISFARGLTESTGGERDVSIPWRLRANQSGGGLIMDMGCHILSRIDYLIGPIVGVKSKVLRKGDGSNYPLVEDCVSMNATVGQCEWSPVSSEGADIECLWDFSPSDKHDISNDVDEFVIEGTKGSLCMGGMGAGLPVKVLNTNGEVVQTLEFDPPKHAAQPLIQSAVNKLIGETPRGSYSFPATPDNAMRTSEVLDSILNSYYGGRHDDFWFREDTWPGLGKERK